jgi:hypothetical protein
MRDDTDTLNDRALADGIAAPLAPATGEGVIEVRRTLDAAGFNKIANHPEVRPWIGGEGEIDLTDTIADLRNHALQIDGGGFLLLARDQGVYEVHSLFLPEARRRSLAAMRSGMEYMFVETDAFRLVTQVPDSHRAAAALALRGGFKEWFRLEHSALGPSSFVSVELDGWIQGHSAFDAAGDWFHDKLREAKGTDLHADDAAHTRAVGAAVRMIFAGNAGKGVAAYNRWAVCAGYAPVQILSAAPLVVDVVDAVVQIGEDGDMAILSVRA